MLLNYILFFNAINLDYNKDYIVVDNKEDNLDNASKLRPNKVLINKDSYSINLYF